VKKPTKVLSDGGDSGIRIEEYRQEEDPSWLASRLAEAYNSMSAHEQNYNTFVAASQAERKKAMDLQMVVFQLKERQLNGGPEKVSRMDPLSGYDLSACEAEIEQLKSRAIELQEIADEHAQKATVAKNEVNSLNKKIREVNSSR
jgi:uncharacterized coiled-coil DUF342 family protein